jgi:hypothetical protein
VVRCAQASVTRAIIAERMRDVEKAPTEEVRQLLDNISEA